MLDPSVGSNLHFILSYSESGRLCGKAAHKKERPPTLLTVSSLGRKRPRRACNALNQQRYERKYALCGAANQARKSLICARKWWNRYAIYAWLPTYMRENNYIFGIFSPVHVGSGGFCADTGQRRSRASGHAAHVGRIWLESVALLPYKVGPVHRALPCLIERRKRSCFLDFPRFQTGNRCPLHLETL